MYVILSSFTTFNFERILIKIRCIKIFILKSIKNDDINTENNPTTFIFAANSFLAFLI